MVIPHNWRAVYKLVVRMNFCLHELLSPVSKFFISPCFSSIFAIDDMSFTCMIDLVALYNKNICIFIVIGIDWYINCMSTVKPLIYGAPNAKRKCFSSRLAVAFAKNNLSQVLSQEWRCSWCSADMRCSNYIWVINNVLWLISIRGGLY